jgi:hypothetical protein
MMSLIQMHSIIRECRYEPDWHIFMLVDKDARPYIQAEVKNSIDTATGEPCSWKSGKRYLSQHMCRQEVVGAVFGLIKDAEMHEVHEWFRYKGASIYNQHLDPDVLVEVARKKSSFNVRDNAMSMEEAA